MTCFSEMCCVPVWLDTQRQVSIDFSWYTELVAYYVVNGTGTLCLQWDGIQTHRVSYSSLLRVKGSNGLEWTLGLYMRQF